MSDKNFKVRLVKGKAIGCLNSKLVEKMKLEKINKKFKKQEGT